MSDSQARDIFNQLAEMKTEMTRLRAELKMVTTHDRVLFGRAGDVDSVGLVTNVDRHEQIIKQRERLAWIVLGASVTAIVGVVISFLFKG